MVAPSCPLKRGAHPHHACSPQRACNATNTLERMNCRLASLFHQVDIIDRNIEKWRKTVRVSEPQISSFISKVMESVLGSI
jgi:hypothetical protein